MGHLSLPATSDEMDNVTTVFGSPPVPMNANYPEDETIPTRRFHLPHSSVSKSPPIKGFPNAGRRYESSAFMKY
jgi:hypothetical protein